MKSNGNGNGLPPIIGESAAIMRAKALAEHFAPMTLPVLLLGATGTGKELFAQWIHHWSGRDGEMVDLNCAALPRELIEAELFGHGPRAFTGAREGKAGLIEAADGSTLFLDEVDSLAWEAQGKLLRVLETGEVRRVGETSKRRVNVRVIAAAQEDLPHRVATGAFRLDLYHRLAGVVIELFALPVRSSDVLLLATHFAGCQGRTLAADAKELLLRYSWPGNVREVRYAVERAACVAQDGVISAAALAEAIALGPGGVTARGDAANGHGERARLLDACRAGGFHGERAAAAYGVSRATLFNRLRSEGLSLRALRESNRV